MYSIKILSAPSVEPVSLAEVKNFLRIDHAADDSMLESFIAAARNYIELVLNRKLITQTWDMWMDQFPGKYNFDNLPEGTSDGALSSYLCSKRFIEIPIFPLQSITHLKTYDDAGTAFTMSPSEYYVDTSSEPGRLSLLNATNWPQTYLRPTNGINVRFVCGYGATAADVPATIKQAILDLVGRFYTNRGCEDPSIPKSTLALLTPFRVMRV